MKSHEVVKLLDGLPESTLRKYVKDFADYLSKPAQGGAGRHREYTEQDARILKLIIDMKAERVSLDDIITTLSSLQAGNWERLPALDEGAQALVPTQANVIALHNERSALQREIDILREMLAKATSDRDDLLERLHRAQTLLELYQAGKLRAD